MLRSVTQAQRRQSEVDGVLWVISPLEGSLNSCSMQQSLMAPEKAVSQADLEPH